MSEIMSKYVHHECTYGYLYIIYIYTHVHIRQQHACQYYCLYVCMYVCMHVCIYIYAMGPMGQNYVPQQLDGEC